MSLVHSCSRTSEHDRLLMAWQCRKIGSIRGSFKLLSAYLGPPTYANHSLLGWFLEGWGHYLAYFWGRGQH